MSELTAGKKFPAAKLQDIDGESVEFPAVFAQAPATVVFFYRGHRPGKRVKELKG